ncbi:MAG: hypothetical protein LBQ30_09930 [Treponema sp.]|jgi:hypothetical protein|nr:hypothetical protein [Treponema sp.]
MTDYNRIFLATLQEHSNDSKWTNALFGGVKTLSNTKVGTVGQAFIEKFCSELGFICQFPTNALGERVTQSPWDIAINNVQFELKTATEDTAMHFQFNHIRYHRPYDALLCLGVSPANLYFGVWSKADVVTGKAGNLVSMEKDANASYKLTKTPQQLKTLDVFSERMLHFIAAFK